MFLHSALFFSVFVSCRCLSLLQLDSAIKILSACLFRVPHHPHRCPTTCLSIWFVVSNIFLWSTSHGPYCRSPVGATEKRRVLWPSALTVPRETIATTTRCYAMSMTGNAHYCPVPLISPRSRPALSLRRFGEETNLQFLGSAFSF